MLVSLSPSLCLCVRVFVRICKLDSKMIPGAYDARACAIFFFFLLHTFLCVNGSSVRAPVCVRVRACVCVCSRELLLIWPPAVKRAWVRERDRERASERREYIERILRHNSLQFQCKFFAIKRACGCVCVCCMCALIYI